MGNQKQKTEAQADKKRRNKIELGAVNEPVEEIADLIRLQTVLLGDGKLPGIQRRMIATQIGEFQGNQYLQRAIIEDTEKLEFGSTLTIQLQQERKKRQDRRDKSMQSRPRDCPRGTRTIDQSGLSKDDIHEIKEGVGAGGPDWVGITPEGHVITSDEEGNVEDHGHYGPFLNKRRALIPQWVWEILGTAAAIALIIALITGVAEFAIILAGLSTVTALAIVGILKALGIRDTSRKETTEVRVGSREEETT
jgi:hypothetical protein